LTFNQYCAILIGDVRRNKFYIPPSPYFESRYLKTSDIFEAGG
jgi:hypothetical protein